jgi:NADH dehydrogenase
VFGLRFSGFVAWWLWRTIYLSKLPRFEKKLRVALDWTLDLLFSKDLVQFRTARGLALRDGDVERDELSCPVPPRRSPAREPREAAAQR